MNIPLVVLGSVFLLIAVRQVGRLRLAIWQSMTLGAIAVLVTGQITPSKALDAVNLDVMAFLFGMFVVGRALEESGYLAVVGHHIFGRVRSTAMLLLALLFAAGFASAVLMNDTLAIIGTPLAILLARRYNLSPKLLLLALAFSITIGSVMSPIGNPQNLLIALGGDMRNPFLPFLRGLALPTILNLLIAFLFLRLYYRGEFKPLVPDNTPAVITDRSLARLARLALLIIAVLILAKICLALLSVEVRLTYIAISGAVPLLLLSRRRLELLRTVDGYTLVFFAAMFVLMGSVWGTGFFQARVDGLNVDITSTPVILAVSILLSQLMSNVPMVALYLPSLLHAGAPQEALLAVAAGSTIAGNLTILGAASNVIIIQYAERHGGQTLTFWEFFRIGAPLVAANTLVYWLFLKFV
ncbi:MAG: SLC13 family permease [Chloroflexi bacterium]|nr:SLC13 family permease [Chloroflexota bacterium]MDA1269811.1 SLC13 family permease [Chloroflexota bacterium]PKB58462.1 MAG: anion transporter [SAR202 cluster bacterium Casp-Chloro-G2]